MSLSGVQIGDFPELYRRREETLRRLDGLAKCLASSNDLVAGKASVYATGSFGRAEASKWSDLDLFIVGRVADPSTSKPDRYDRLLLSRLDEICLKAELIIETKKAGIPKFDGDGRYLVQYSIEQLRESLGTQDDDSSNTFTARLLMLLESKPLLNSGLHAEAIDKVIESYWRDFDDHQENFVPAYLTNDILRLWRTFCVNYEARTEDQPQEKKIKRKIKNFKLKYSRLITCYSSIMYLLAIYGRNGTVMPDDARQMALYSPIDRLFWVLDQSDLSRAHSEVKLLISMYDDFLHVTNVESKVLAEVFGDPSQSALLLRRARDFGDLMHETLASIGADSRLYRLLIV